MDETSRDAESDFGASLVLAGCVADSDDKVSEECGRILSQVERVVWSIGQPPPRDLWSTGHLSADIVGRDVGVGEVEDDDRVTGSSVCRVYHTHMTSEASIQSGSILL